MLVTDAPVDNDDTEADDDVDEGLVTNDIGSEVCLGGGSLSWGRWGEVVGGEESFLWTWSTLDRELVDIMSVSSLLQALASSSRGLFRDRELV